MKSTYEIQVCVDCHMAHHGYEVESNPEPWALFPEGTEIADSSVCEACHKSNQDCEHNAPFFSNASCEGCGNTLAGDRHRYVFFEGDLATKAEIARYFSVKPATVANWIRRYPLFPAPVSEGVKGGQGALYDLEKVEDWVKTVPRLLQEKTVKPKPEVEDTHTVVVRVPIGTTVEVIYY